MSHFNGSDPNCKIHTAKSGTCAKGSCNYRANTAGPHPPDEWEAHHILCYDSVNAYGTMPTASQIADCYRLTDWCLNQKENMLALPLKQTYVAYPTSTSMNLPCHNLHHNCKLGYRHEVTEAIKKKIWQMIDQAVAEANQQQAHFTPKEVKGEFEALEGEFRDLLILRGKRGNGGTAGEFHNQGSITNNWWLPFSMAADAVALSRPRPRL